MPARGATVPLPEVPPSSRTHDPRQPPATTSPAPALRPSRRRLWSLTTRTVRLSGGRSHRRPAPGTAASRRRTTNRERALDASAGLGGGAVSRHRRRRWEHGPGIVSRDERASSIARARCVFEFNGCLQAAADQLASELQLPLLYSPRRDRNTPADDSKNFRRRSPAASSLVPCERRRSSRFAAHARQPMTCRWNST